MKPKIGIDPGKSGGFAIIDEYGDVTAENMPDGVEEIVDRLAEIKRLHPKIECVIEKTGTYVPGNSGVAAATFARHCGNLEGVVHAIGMPLTQVAPSVWMKRLGAMPKDKKARKKKIKTDMAFRYPHIKVTLNTADALGILTTEVDK
jgi:hypothetical protein